MKVKQIPPNKPISRGLITQKSQTLICWSLQFHTEAIFADNFPQIADNLIIKKKLSTNWGKMSAKMASVWNCRVHRSGVSARLPKTPDLLHTSLKVVSLWS